MEYAQNTGQSIGLPDVGSGFYLVEAFLRLGPTRSDAFGPRPVDWPEIAAFARLTGRIEEPWEAEVIYDMAAAYLLAKTSGEDPLAVAPVDQDVDGQAG